MFALICKPTVIYDVHEHLKYVEPTKCKMIQYIRDNGSTRTQNTKQNRLKL